MTAAQRLISCVQMPELKVFDTVLFRAMQHDIRVGSLLYLYNPMYPEFDDYHGLSLVVSCDYAGPGEFCNEIYYVILYVHQMSLEMTISVGATVTLANQPGAFNTFNVYDVYAVREDGL